MLWGFKLALQKSITKFFPPQNSNSHIGSLKLVTGGRFPPWKSVNTISEFLVGEGGRNEEANFPTHHITVSPKTDLKVCT